jgi:hypothetical protein
MRRRTAIGLLAGAPAIGALVGGAAMARPSAPNRTPVRTMLEMTFPEFEAAIAKTDISLVPVGAIEAHGPHLPLGADAVGAVDQLGDVQAYLRDAGFPSIVGPALNIGITNEGDDRAKGRHLHLSGQPDRRFGDLHRALRRSPALAEGERLQADLSL